MMVTAEGESYDGQYDEVGSASEILEGGGQ
jgi:hypothetical protein